MYVYIHIYTCIYIYADMRQGHHGILLCVGSIKFIKFCKISNLKLKTIYTLYKLFKHI